MCRDFLVHYIEVVPLSFTFGQEHIKETDIDNKAFYAMMEEKGEIPRSSQPPVRVFMDLYERCARKGKAVLGIFLSDKMSGTVETARMAARLVKEETNAFEFEIINSGTNCMDMGYAVLQAAEAARAGESLGRIKSLSEHLLRCSRFVFAPSNLDYLKKGGRIGGAQALIGNMLRITPILTVNDQGYADVFEKTRTQKKAIRKMIDQFSREIETHGFRHVAVHHINALGTAENLAASIKSMTGFSAPILPIGPVIGLHVGPGAVGIAYTTEKEIRKERGL